MKKALEVAKEISKEYSQNIVNERYKNVFCESVGNDSIDEFSVFSRAKQLSIHASSPRAAAYAIGQLGMYVRGERPQEMFVRNIPLYSLRPVWIQCDRHVSVSENVGCYLPSFFLGKKKESFEKFCHRLLELGFNAVVLGSHHEMIGNKSSTTFKELQVLQDLFEDYGIQMIIKPVLYYPQGKTELTSTPTDGEFRQHVSVALSDLQRFAPALKFVFWESLYCDQDFHYHPSGRGYSKYEKTLMELRLVESSLSDNTSLIYYLPSVNQEMAKKQALWFGRLLNGAGSRTILAFSCVAGHFAADHQKRHPFWEVLEKTVRPCSTPVLPILNSGGVKQGEGYWPNFPFDLFDEHLSFQVDFPLAGFIQTFRTIPKKGSLADACAWVGGMSMWRRRYSRQLLEIWFRAHHPQGDFDGLAALLKKARVVILQLSAFDDFPEIVEAPEEVKSCIETTLALLKEIEVALKMSGKKQSFTKGAIVEVFQLFIKDARRKVLQHAHKKEVSVKSFSGEDFKGEGVWTQLNHGGVGEGAVSTGKVVCHEEPNIGPEGSLSHKVYCEVNIEVN